MADSQIKPQTTLSPTCMESVNRVAKLPVVESTLQTATSLYEKVKDYNSVTHWTCATAESAVNKAVEVGKPIVHSLESPIRKVDDVLCSGLDYVEAKVPAVKLPAGEIYTTTKDYVNNTAIPAVQNTYAYVEPTVKSAYGKIEPAVETAKTYVEPAVEKAKTVVEPLVQPALEKAQALKDSAVQKFEEFVHHNHGDNLECDECKSNAKKTE